MNDLKSIFYAAYDPGTGELTQSGNMSRKALEYLAKDRGWTWVEVDRPLDYRRFRIDPETKKPVEKPQGDAPSFASMTGMTPTPSPRR